MSDTLKIKMFCVTLDCADAKELANFYAKFLGLEQGVSEDLEFIWAGMPGQYPFLTFQQIDNYIPPVWPGTPEASQTMEHIDFAVNDLEKAVQHAVNCGAIIADQQFSESWRVMIDPAGHPFCLCQKKTIFTI
jgi:catechol 2,3-dioxygenase-like lactoylglutathione lyase family enzyme